MKITVKEAIMWDRWKNCPAEGDSKDVYCVSIAEVPSIPDDMDPEIKRYIEDEISTRHPLATTLATLFALAGHPVTCVNNVWDWGEGCPPHKREKIFRRYCPRVHGSNLELGARKDDRKNCPRPPPIGHAQRVKLLTDLLTAFIFPCNHANYRR